jgi:hypothetical protein
MEYRPRRCDFGLEQFPIKAGLEKVEEGVRKAGDIIKVLLGELGEVELAASL